MRLLVCRSNAIPNLVDLVSSGDSPNVREYSAAVLACMAHTMDVQVREINLYTIVIV